MSNIKLKHHFLWPLAPVGHMKCSNWTDYTVSGPLPQQLVMQESWVGTLVPGDSSFCSIQVKKSPDCALIDRIDIYGQCPWYHCKRPMLNYDTNFLIQQSLSKRMSSLENTYYSFVHYLLGSQFQCVHSFIWVIKSCYGSFHGAADIKNPAPCPLSKLLQIRGLIPLI